MKIYSIKTYDSTNVRQNYKSQPNVKNDANLQNKMVSFGTIYSSEAEKMAKEAGENYGFWGWRVFGGYEKELENAQNALDKKHLETEIALARQQATVEAGEKHLQTMKDALAETTAA